MHSYEFLAGLQRLGLIATMLEATDVDGLVQHLAMAEAALPITGGDGAKLAEIRRFVHLTRDYQAQCRAYHDSMDEAQHNAGRIRRQLVAPADSPPGASEGAG